VISSLTPQFINYTSIASLLPHSKSILRLLSVFDLSISVCCRTVSHGLDTASSQHIARAARSVLLRIHRCDPYCLTHSNERYPILRQVLASRRDYISVTTTHELHSHYICKDTRAVNIALEFIKMPGRLYEAAAIALNCPEVWLYWF
jgi:hypothetical protein